MKLWFVLYFILFGGGCFYAQLPAIGLWRDHLNHKNALQIVEGDKIYAATTNSILIINEQINEIETLTKSTGLSDIGIKCIAYDAFSKQLVIAYNNSNIDIYKNGVVKKINDIVRSSITGDKTINQIFCQNGIAYISTGLGLVVLDLTKYEIKETYFLGNAQSKIKINATTIVNNFIYAATIEGLKRANFNSNLSNINNWNNLSGTSNLTWGEINNTLNLNGSVIIQKNDSLFSYDGNIFSFIFTDTNWPIVSTNATNNKILVCNRRSNGDSKVLVLNAFGIVEKNIAVPNTISFPRQATIINNNVWVADFFGGVSKEGITSYIVNGPPGNADGQILFANKIIMAAAGSVNDNYNYQFNRNGVYFFENEIWSSISNFNNSQLDSLLDFTNLAFDKNKNIVYAGSFGGGLIELVGNSKITIFKQNSLILPAIGDPNNYRVSGITFDIYNNLWIANYGSPKPLVCKKANGQFVNFNIPYTLIENAVTQMVFDNSNNLYIVSPKGNGLLCYNYGNSIDDTNDDKWKIFRQGNQNGNLPSAQVNCISKDKDGLIWVGTKNGIAIITCFEDVFNTNCKAVLPIVNQNNFSSYLFANEDVQCITVDGANRKWVGTKNGTWLISSNGQQILNYFNQSNSPLLNNNVKNIEVNPITGEVFFATISGICSYRGTAVETIDNQETALVFPNPVYPNFKGLIAIKNVPTNSILKITELNGTLVFQTKSNGNQAVWNGLNYHNQKVKAGVYLVFAKTQESQEKLVAKLLIVE